MTNIEEMTMKASLNGFNLGITYGAQQEQARIIKLLQIGGPIEKIICDYWGDPGFDKDDALVLIEQAIKGETE